MTEPFSVFILNRAKYFQKMPKFNFTYVLTLLVNNQFYDTKYTKEGVKTKCP